MDEDTPAWDPSINADIENGLGAVWFQQGDKTKQVYLQGRLPIELLRQFAARAALINLLQAWTAIVAPLGFRPWLKQLLRTVLQQGGC